MSENIRLFPYQEEMVERIEKTFLSCRSVMVQMPTGTGKTHVIASVTKDYVGKGSKVIIIAHRRELVSQIRHTIGLYLEEAEMQNVAVTSVQWLNRHIAEVKDKPALIVIDEAHHAVAKTYSSVIGAFAQARVLGLTATPCRLNGHPFTDLFDILLQSHPINWFIGKEYLSLYDYMSVRPDNEEVKIINTLCKRGADGDFSLKEMSEKLDVHPSLERLCDSIKKYAGGKKGIVYAIDIRHAEHIAEMYRQNGIKAVTISSKTPAKEREDILDRFRNTHTDSNEPLKDDDIQVMVNVALFDEGFDCPDVEFIQMARPTLSLSRYLQMVGRGLRIFDGKKYCLILDNVGNYRLFGLPSADRDWQTMFDGGLKGKGNVKKSSVTTMTLSALNATKEDSSEMISILTHDKQMKDLNVEYGYSIFQTENNKYGIKDDNGEMVVPAHYKLIKLYPNAIASLSDKASDTRPLWMDIINGVTFRSRPTIIRKGWLELTTADGVRYYPRVKTRSIDNESYTNMGVLQSGIDDGLRFKNFFIQPSEPRKLYKYVEKSYYTSLYTDDEGRLFVKHEYKLPLEPIDRDEWEKKKVSDRTRIGYYYKASKNKSYLKEKHTIEDIGFLKFDKYGDVYFFHDKKAVIDYSFSLDSIRFYGRVCFLGNQFVIVEGQPHVPLRITKRYIDGHRFIVRYYPYASIYKETYEAKLFFDGKGNYKLFDNKYVASFWYKDDESLEYHYK